MSEGRFSTKSQRGGGAPRFHSHAGLNVRLERNQQTAVRTASFANAITFSEKPLAPGEIFLVEIEETETGWSGHMRLGLTQLNPNTEFELPYYALPDLLSMGPCWLYAVTKRNHRSIDSLENRYDELPLPIRPGNGIFREPTQIRRHIESLPLDDDDDVDAIEGFANMVLENNPNIGFFDVPEPRDTDDTLDENAINTDHQRKSIFNRDPVLRREGDVTWTPCGFIEHRILTGHSVTEGDVAQLPTDVGSRIGVMFVPTGDNTANMHFIINGEGSAFRILDQGPCSRDIPYKVAPIYAVIDVYGSTKKLRTCQIYGVDTLQSRCRDTILHSIRLSGVRSLPLPNLLKKYLLFHD